MAWLPCPSSYTPIGPLGCCNFSSPSPFSSSVKGYPVFKLKLFHSSFSLVRAPSGPINPWLKIFCGVLNGRVVIWLACYITASVWALHFTRLLSRPQSGSAREGDFGLPRALVWCRMICSFTSTSTNRHARIYKLYTEFHTLIFDNYSCIL